MAGTITAIEVQKKQARRANIYVDGVFVCGVALEVVVQSGLRRGQVISDAEIEQLAANDSFERAYASALRLLSYRPRSESEVRRHLTSKKVAPALIEQVVERLKTARLLDDAAFAQFWVENRETFNPRGRRMLRRELQQKGVDAATIDTALDVDETESAYQAAQRKTRALAGLDYNAFRCQLGDYLLRRGFDYVTVHATVRRLWREQQADQPDTGEADF
jgi:regulatory protein